MTPDGDIHVAIEQPKGQGRDAPPLIPSLERHRCQNPTCLRWCYAGGLGGQRSLGLETGIFCGRCTEDLILRCLEKYDRLPRPGEEFYCRVCGCLRPVSDQTPHDRDGRQRLLCWPCRRAQVHRAHERRVRRRRRAASA